MIPANKCKEKTKQLNERNFMKNKLRLRNFMIFCGIATIFLCIMTNQNAFASTKLSVPKNFEGSYSINKFYESTLTVKWDKLPGAKIYEVYCRYTLPDAEFAWEEWEEIQNTNKTSAKATTIDGYMQIKVRAYDGSNYSDFTPAITILGGEGIVTDIKEKLNLTSKSITLGSSCKLKIENVENEITWSSNKPSVATVSSSGKVTGVSSGTSTITATSNGKKFTCKITVKEQSAADAYKNILKKGKYSLKIEGGNTISFDIKSYLYLDFDKNGTKELLISNYDLENVYNGTSGVIISYKKGKIIDSGYLNDIISWNGKVAYNKKYKGIPSTYHPMVGMRGYDAEMYTYESGEVTSKYPYGNWYVDSEDEFYASIEYSAGKKYVTEKQYSAYINKYYNDKDTKYYTLKENKYD